MRNDRKRRWLDNVFAERLRRSVKYEHIYFHAYETVSQAVEPLFISRRLR